MNTSNAIHSTRETASSIESLETMAASQRADLAETLANILSLKPSDADRLLDRYPKEAVALYVVFAEKVRAYGDHAREWRANTMALLPLPYWRPAVAQDGPNMVTDNPYSSLKYMSHREVDRPRALQQLTNRRALHRALVEALHEEDRKTYEPLLAWDEKGPADAHGRQHHPHLQDMALWQLLQAVEFMFDSEYATRETQLRARLHLSELQATPADAIELLSRHAAIGIRERLVDWGITDLLAWEPQALGVAPAGTDAREEAGTGPHRPLVLSVLCNLAANRVLLERSRIQSLAAVGAQANQALLEALNRNGIFQAPDPDTYRYDEEGIRRLLLEWFGPSGVLRNEQLEGGPLSGQDLEAVLVQARNIQDRYVHSRGYLWPQQHRSSYDNFLFALAAAACHCAGIKLQDEFFPSKRKPAIPARNLGVRRAQLPGPEAIELLKAMYGQLLYGNPGSRLQAAGIRRYAQGFLLRHACLQDLLFNMFKRLSPPRLLAFDRLMTHLAQQNEMGLDDADREATAGADRVTRFGLALRCFYQVRSR